MKYVLIAGALSVMVIVEVSNLVRTAERDARVDDFRKTTQRALKAAEDWEQIATTWKTIAATWEVVANLQSDQVNVCRSLLPMEQRQSLDNK